MLNKKIKSVYETQCKTILYENVALRNIEAIIREIPCLSVFVKKQSVYVKQKYKIRV